MSRSTRATIDDVATLADVSTATVSRVINQTGPVAPETTARVWAAIAELEYVPDAAARRLAGRRTKTLGLLVPVFRPEFFAITLRGVELAARDVDYDLLVYISRRELNPNAGPIHPVGEHNTDGIIIFEHSLTDAEIARLHRREFPMVLLHRPPPDSLDIPYVIFTNRRGVREAIDHLIEMHNCRRIGFLRGPESSGDSPLREQGYRESLETHGIPFDPELIGQGNFNTECARATVQDWLTQGLELDAVFAGDDEAAVGAITAIKQAGKRVPEDVAVVGFDDVSLAHHLTPSLTTVHAPIEEVGREAVQQLVHIIQGDKTDPVVKLSTRLAIRQSCGCQQETP